MINTEILSKKKSEARASNWALWLPSLFAVGPSLRTCPKHAHAQHLDMHRQTPQGTTNETPRTLKTIVVSGRHVRLFSLLLLCLSLVVSRRRCRCRLRSPTDAPPALDHPRRRPLQSPTPTPGATRQRCPAIDSHTRGCALSVLLSTALVVSSGPAQARPWIPQSSRSFSYLHASYLPPMRPLAMSAALGAMALTWRSIRANQYAETTGWSC